MMKKMKMKTPTVMMKTSLTLTMRTPTVMMESNLRTRTPMAMMTAKRIPMRTRVGMKTPMVKMNPTRTVTPVKKKMA